MRVWRRIKTLFSYIGLILGEMSSGLIFWTGSEHWRKPTWPIGIALNCLGVAMAFLSIRQDMFKYRMGYNDGFIDHLRAMKRSEDERSVAKEGVTAECLKKRSQ